VCCMHIYIAAAASAAAAAPLDVLHLLHHLLLQVSAAEAASRALQAQLQQSARLLTQTTAEYDNQVNRVDPSRWAPHTHPYSKPYTPKHHQSSNVTITASCRVVWLNITVGQQLLQRGAALHLGVGEAVA